MELKINFKNYVYTKYWVFSKVDVTRQRVPSCGKVTFIIKLSLRKMENITEGLQYIFY